MLVSADLFPTQPLIAPFNINVNQIRHFSLFFPPDFQVFLWNHLPNMGLYLKDYCLIFTREGGENFIII